MAVVWIFNKYSFHNCRLFSCSYQFFLNILQYIKDFILFVSLCTLLLIVSHLIKSSLLRPGLPHGYVNFSGHQLDEPTGFSGGLEQ